MRRIAAAIRKKTGKRVSLWFEDEARLGQKGRTCHMWWTRGERPTGICDRRFTFAYIFGAAKIGSDDAFALVMPEANTEAMQIFLDTFEKTLPSDEIAIMFADQAGWHKANDLVVPSNVRLLPIPAYMKSIRSSASGST